MMRLKFSSTKSSSPFLPFLWFTFLLFICSYTVAQSSTVKYKPVATQIKPSGVQGFFPGEVKLLDGPFKESMDAEANYLLSLDIDRLLAPYLIEADIPTKAIAYPGWETETLPGVSLGFYLSGASRIYMMTGRKQFLAHINYILSQLELCQHKQNGYVLGTKGGKKIMARVEKEGFFPEFGNWANGEATPYYSFEKLLSGLRDAYRIIHIKKAFEISVQLGNWIAQHMSHIKDADLQKLMFVEYGGMNWVLSDLYADTGDPRFLALSLRWQDNITVVPSMNGLDVLNGKHANMQFPKFSGLAARYPFSGDTLDLSGAKFFWDNVVKHRSYVTGGNSESEYFGARDSLSKKLSPFTTENCNEYNMLRLTQLLNGIEPRVEYADYMERTLFNHILASQNPKDGSVCYYLPLIPGAERFYQSLYESFKCCVASAMDSYTRHGEYIYAHNKNHLYVNLFIASEVTDKENGITLKQVTNFPEKEITTLSVQCAKPVSTFIAIRNPYWANNKVTIKINGELRNIPAAGDGYFYLNRIWQNKDIVEVQLPMELRSESMPDDKNKIALFYGPILLAAVLNKNQANDLLQGNYAPALLTGNKPVNEWLKQTGASLNFTTSVGKPEQAEVVPLYSKKTGAYAVYWQQLNEAEWKIREATVRQKTNEQNEIQLMTIDMVSAGDSLLELTHALDGTSKIGVGNYGINTDVSWRASFSNAFGYTLIVSDTKENSLYCKFMGRNDYEKWSCKITIDGVPIKTLLREKDDSYPVVIWDAVYTIPIELTKGKHKVAVKFEPLEKDKMNMPRFIQARMLIK